MKRQWAFIAVVTFVIFLSPFLIDVFSQAGQAILGEETIKENNWLTEALVYGPFLVLLLIFLYATLQPMKNFGFKYSKELLMPAALLGIAAGIIIFLIDILTGTLDNFGVPATPSASIFFGFMITWAVLAPVVEETFFRGVIQSKFLKIKSTAFVHPSIWIACVFEVAFHLIVPLYFGGDTILNIVLRTLPQLSYVLVFSVISGYLYYRTRSLLPAIIFHGLGNVVELLLFWLL